MTEQFREVLRTVKGAGGLIRNLVEDAVEDLSGRRAREYKKHIARRQQEDPTFDPGKRDSDSYDTSKSCGNV